MLLRDFIVQKVDADFEGNQSKFARKVGLSVSSVNKIIHSDTSPRLDTMHKVAKAFNLPISFFADSADYTATAAIHFRPEDATTMKSTIDQLATPIKEIKEEMPYITMIRDLTTEWSKTEQGELIGWISAMNKEKQTDGKKQNPAHLVHGHGI